jgi:soluble lytic murein transglycosylase-like protein
VRYVHVLLAASAICALSGCGGTEPPRVDALIDKYALQYRVDPYFARVIQEIEDPERDPKATSRFGARGFFQLIPRTFAAMGVGNDITDPEQNIHAGIKYLSQQLARYDGDWVKAAGAYNGGPGAIDTWLQNGGGDLRRHLRAETVAYMARVAQARADWFRRLTHDQRRS